MTLRTQPSESSLSARDFAAGTALSRPYICERDDAPPSGPDPVAGAAALWRRLTEHQPAVAAALTLQLRALPAEWSLRELGVARPEAVLELPSAALPLEVEPYDADAEECPACAALDAPCRWHAGYIAGQQDVLRPLAEVTVTNPDVTVTAALRQLDEEAEAAERGASEEASHDESRGDV